MQLRPYQQAAVDAVYNHLRDRDDNPCVVIPTAGGKGDLITTITATGGRPQRIYSLTRCPAKNTLNQ